MKKTIFRMAMLAAAMLTATTMTSCLNSDEETIVLEDEQMDGSLQKDYFTIEDATFKNGKVPEATDDEQIGYVTYNAQALSGGMNFITVKTTRPYKYFYISVKGVPGYYIYQPKTYTREGRYYVYTIYIYYTTTYNEDITMYVSGETEDGYIPEPYVADITYIDSKSGDLNINLTFTTAKDVDLHLQLPSGVEIYYANRGGTYTLNDGSTVTFGLDHDSNAGCTIDNLNNENIYIPGELLTAGTYKVFVNLYENCNRSVGPTNWSVVARYKGQTLRNELSGYSNPATGSYAAAANSGDHTEVIRFTLTESQVGSTRSGLSIVPSSFKPTPLSDMDLMKKEEASWK